MHGYDIFGRSRRLDTTREGLKRSTGVLGIFFTTELAIHFFSGLFAIWLIARLGPEHLSAATLALTIIVIAYSFYLEISTGVTTLVSQRVGSGDPFGAGQVLGQAIILNALLSIPVAIGGTLLAPRLLEIMGANADVVRLGVPYLRWWIVPLFFLPLPFLFSAALRALGDAPTVAFVQLQLLITQLLLMPIFVFGIGPVPPMGASGTVLAIVISRVLAILIQLRALRKYDSAVKFDLISFWPNLPTMRGLISLTIPVTGQQLVRLGAEAIVVRLVASYGIAAIAAYAISIRLLQLLETVGQGLGNAAFTIVGQNIGARQGSRARRGTWIAILYGVVVNGVGVLLLLVWAPPLIAFFDAEQSVVAIGTSALRIIGISFIFTTVALILMRSFHGAGDTVSPVIIDLIALWGIQLPLAVGLAAAGWGITGIWLAISIAQTSRAVVLLLWFRRSRQLHIAFSRSMQPP